MSKVLQKTDRGRMVLDAATAADLMSENPISVQADATVPDAIQLLTRRSYSAAPVIDMSGRAIGVVSRSDVLVHDRERLAASYEAPEKLAEPAAPATVRDIMTPVVFAVTPDTPVEEVIKQLLDWKVHHLFVIDDAQVLVGVISTLDVLKRLVSK